MYNSGIMRFAGLTVLAFFARGAALLAQTTRLELGKPVQGRIEVGRNDSYALDLEAGEYIELLAEQTAVDVALRLSGPDGKQIQEVNHLGIGGTELLIQLADRDGEYKLEVRPVAAGAAGDYSVRLALRRAADPRDREVAQADTRFRHYLRQTRPTPQRRWRSLPTRSGGWGSFGGRLARFLQAAECALQSTVGIRRLRTTARRWRHGAGHRTALAKAAR